MAALAAVCAAIALIVARPWPQDPGYHHFADTRRLAGIPNALNVLSNLPFLIAALYAWRTTPRLAPGDRRLPARIYALGLGLTGIGSAIYHAFPGDSTLVLDRAGMIVAFMATVALLAGDYAGRSVNATLVIAELAGMASLAIWRYADDLRLYGVVQAFPALMLILLPLFFRSRYTRGGLLAYVVVFYVVAKVCELFDRQVYAATQQLVSGHSLKHIAAAAASMAIVAWLRARVAIAGGN